MALRNAIETLATKLVWPGFGLEWATGYSRHRGAGAPHVDGVRMMVLDSQGNVVDAVDAETLPALLAKVVERFRVKFVRERQRERRARWSRAAF